LVKWAIENSIGGDDAIIAGEKKYKINAEMAKMITDKLGAKNEVI
jgi:hypothetical protein